MRSALAALVAACFTAAISTPDVGLLVHHHAGGEAFHVHDDLDEPHAHHHDDDDHDHHLEAHHHHHHDAAEHDDDGPGLSEAGPAWTWHSHATRPFHRAVASPSTRIAPPRPIRRLAPTPPVARLSSATIATRSRGPPPLRSK